MLSVLIALGNDTAYVMAQLGHADPKFTRLHARDPARRWRAGAAAGRSSQAVIAHQWALTRPQATLATLPRKRPGTTKAPQHGAFQECARLVSNQRALACEEQQR
jgi:hypothetical protein